MNNNVVVQIVKSGNRFNAWDADGQKWTSKIGTSTRKSAYEKGMALEQRTGKSGRTFWRKVQMSEFENTSEVVIDMDLIDVPVEHADMLKFIHSSYKLKPKGLVMKELKWKYLIRSAVRGKNILMTGPAGSGKTVLCSTAPSPTLIISAEGGLLSIRESNVSAIEVTSVADIAEIYDYLYKNPGELSL